MKAVARVFHFPPSELSLLYLDSEDYLSLGFWYDDAVELDKEIKASIKPGKGKK